MEVTEFKGLGRGKAALKIFKHKKRKQHPLAGFRQNHLERGEIFEAVIRTQPACLSVWWGYFSAWTSLISEKLL